MVEDDDTITTERVTESSAPTAANWFLRPDVEVYEVSADNLMLVRTNFTVTFSQPVVVGLILTLIDKLTEGGTEPDIVKAVALGADKSTEFAQYAFDILKNHGCLYSSQDPNTQNPPQYGIERFASSIGFDPQTFTQAVTEDNSIIVIPEEHAKSASQVMKEGGFNHVNMVQVSRERKCEQLLGEISSIVNRDKPNRLVAWGFTYHSALYRLINELAIEQRLPVLFGTVEGVVGRIGPYVYSPDTPCLECLITRKSANAGSQEQRLIREYRARHASRVPPLPPAHPLFVESVLRLLTIELTQLALGRYSRTLGGLVEFHYGGGSEFHSILRVPFCKVCQNSSPHRLAWDIDFTAPLVKSASI